MIEFNDLKEFIGYLLMMLLAGVVLGHIIVWVKFKIDALWEKFSRKKKVDGDQTVEGKEKLDCSV